MPLDSEGREMHFFKKMKLILLSLCKIKIQVLLLITAALSRNQQQASWYHYCDKFKVPKITSLYTLSIKWAHLTCVALPVWDSSWTKSVHIVHHISDNFWLNNIIALGIQVPSVASVNKEKKKAACLQHHRAGFCFPL